MLEPSEDRSSGELDPFVGLVLEERYRIEAPLGEGGIGRVYRARNLRLDRPVALKVLLEEHKDTDLLRQRFECRRRWRRQTNSRISTWIPSHLSTPLINAVHEYPIVSAKDQHPKIESALLYYEQTLMSKCHT